MFSAALDSVARPINDDMEHSGMSQDDGNVSYLQYKSELVRGPSGGVLGKIYQCCLDSIEFVKCTEFT